MTLYRRLSVFLLFALCRLVFVWSLFFLNRKDQEIIDYLQQLAAVFHFLV